MFIQDDESTGKDKGEVKSTPSINQEVSASRRRCFLAWHFLAWQ
jgi:hypothetical protein